jgi:thymidylate synthase (FAD)
MKIVPMSVELLAMTVGATMKDGEPVILPEMGMEEVIERCGRTCYKSEDKITPTSAIGFAKRIMKRGHVSVVEHCAVTIVMVMDRGISHELVRHRIAAYSQESTRYVNYKEGITVIEPPDLSEFSRLAWLKSCEHAEEAYGMMIKDGCKPEIARSVLPTCLKTEVVSTYNLRQWVHVLEQRMNKVCHPQMRDIQRKCHDILVKISPTLFDTHELRELRDAKKD